MKLFVDKIVNFPVNFTCINIDYLHRYKKYYVIKIPLIKQFKD